MTIVWLLFICSVIVLPATALWALRWAVRNGEFRDMSRIALTIFDEDEPIGRQTDFFPGQATTSGTGGPPAPNSKPPGPAHSPSR
jgi:nitrogen fixation-related uncharacterized protein